MKLFFIFYLILNCLIHASEESNTSELIEPGYIDMYHGAFSAKVHEWGVGIDTMVLDIYDYFGDANSSYISDEKRNIYTFDTNKLKNQLDENRSTQDTNIRPGIVEDSNKSVTQEVIGQTDRDQDVKVKNKNYHLEEGLKVDEFFLTRKLLEERDKSYIRVSFIDRINSLENEDFSADVKARLYLGKSRKKLRFFIESFNEDTARNIASSDSDEEAPAIGIQRSSKKRFGIKPRYSIGLRGLDAFVRARYSYKSNVSRWTLEPIQTFTYAIKDEFSELTELYLSTPTSDTTLLRFVVDRGTHSGVDGMHYDGFAQYFYRPRKYAGLSFNLGFNGHTKYEKTLAQPPFVKQENKVFNYLFLLRWRENIWRKWLFYEIGPGVNYHEEHGYRPNYNIFFGLDLFFGHV